MNLLHETLLITISLHRRICHDKLITLTKNHGFNESEILDAIELLIKRRQVNVGSDLLLEHVEKQAEKIPAGYLQAADNYRNAKKKTGLVQFIKDFFAWDKIKFPICLMIFTTFFAIGLCAQSMPKWVLAGMLHVESSSYYNDGKIVYVNKKRGKSGEIGCFQALPTTLRQFKFSPSLYEQDTEYAEQATIKILCHYYNVTGCWHEAVGAWNCGLGKRKTDTAKQYVNCVKNAGSN